MRNKARISLLTVLLLTAPAFAFEENSLDLGRFDRVDLEAGLFRGAKGRGWPRCAFWVSATVTRKPAMAAVAKILP